MMLRHITAAEMGHQQKRERERERERERDRVREIKREREREGEQPLPAERDIGIFSIMGFDSATSRFLASLVSKVLSSKPSPRLEKFRWPVMVVKIRKRQKILNNFGNTYKF